MMGWKWKVACAIRAMNGCNNAARTDVYSGFMLSDGDVRRASSSRYKLVFCSPVNSSGLKKLCKMKLSRFSSSKTVLLQFLFGSSC